MALVGRAHGGASEGGRTSLFRRKESAKAPEAAPSSYAPPPIAQARVAAPEELPPDVSPLLVRAKELRPTDNTPDAFRAAAKSLAAILSEARVTEDLSTPSPNRYRGPMVELMEVTASLASQFDEGVGFPVGEAGLYNRLANACEVRGMLSRDDGVAAPEVMEAVSSWLAKAAAVAPDNALVWRNFAYVARSRKNALDEETALRKATEVAPDDAEAWIDFGFERLRHGTASEAISAYNRAIAADPQSELAWTRKGQALFAAKNYEEALECFDQAIVSVDTFVEAWRWKAMVSYLQKRSDVFAACAERAIALGADQGDLLFYWAEHLNDAGRVGESLEVLDRIHANDPNHGPALMLKARIFASLGKYAEARELLQRGSENMERLSSAETKR